MLENSNKRSKSSCTQAEENFLSTNSFNDLKKYFYFFINSKDIRNLMAANKANYNLISDEFNKEFNMNFRVKVTFLSNRNYKECYKMLVTKASDPLNCTTINDLLLSKMIKETHVNGERLKMVNLVTTSHKQDFPLKFQIYGVTGLGDGAINSRQKFSESMVTPLLKRNEIIKFTDIDYNPFQLNEKSIVVLQIDTNI